MRRKHRKELHARLDEIESALAELARQVKRMAMAGRFGSRRDIK